MSGSPDRDILNIDEAAQLLGVSVKTFNKVLHTQSLPARKIGREWKFSRQALIAWIGSGRSDQFYREGEPRNGMNQAQEPQVEQGEIKPAPSRRTSGWQLELD
jgi:excisionase family DNA binding protein